MAFKPLTFTTPGSPPKAAETDEVIANRKGVDLPAAADAMRVRGKEISNLVTGLMAGEKTFAPREVSQALSDLADLLRALGEQDSVAQRFSKAITAVVEAEKVHAANESSRATRRTWAFGLGRDETPGFATAEERARVLGSKGAHLREMAELALPVSPGTTITTESCAAFLETGQWPIGLADQLTQDIRDLEARVGKRFGDPKNPLLLSVRSGAEVSMPGMLTTILNVGINDEICEGIERQGHPRLAQDTYRRFIATFGTEVMGIDPSHFEEALERLRLEKKKKGDAELSADDLREVVQRFKAVVQQHAGRDVPSDPHEQLRMAVDAVFGSWNSPRAMKFREIAQIQDLPGTAVNVLAMVFGNMGPTSGSGVCFTRDPATGERKLYGEFMFDAQGEDVVAGVRTPVPLSEMERLLPDAYQELVRYCEVLEQHYGNAQEVEFTVEQGKLTLLQTRNAKRTGDAAIKIAVDMVEAGLIDERKAVLQMVEPGQIAHLLRPHFATRGAEDSELLARGVGASPGCAVGKAAFTSEDAIAYEKQGIPTILFRPTTRTEDVDGIHVASGVVTQVGGKSSHAAVVTRAWGVPCVTGCDDLVIDEKDKSLTVGSMKVEHGDWVSIDGTTGEVLLGKRDLVSPTPKTELAKFMEMVNRVMLQHDFAASPAVEPQIVDGPIASRTTDAQLVLSPRRTFNIYDLLHNFYVGEMLECMGDGSVVGAAVERWKDDLAQAREELIRDSVPMIHDYLFDIVVHELWSGSRFDGTWQHNAPDWLRPLLTVNHDNTRDYTVVREAIEARGMTWGEFRELVKEWFMLPGFRHEYGGEPWVRIADLLGNIDPTTPDVWLDQVFHAQHNTSTVFNKGGTGAPEVSGEDPKLRGLLDFRRDCDDPRAFSDFALASADGMDPSVRKFRDLVRRAEKLGLS